MFLSKIIPASIKRKIRKRFERTVKVYTAVKPYEIKVEFEPELKDRIAIVTGGSGAIGRAICFRLAAMGATVYVGGRSESSSMKVVDEIRQSGLNAEPFVIDVSDEASVEEAFNSIRDNEGKLDILVNCAGGGARDAMASLADQDIKIIDEIMASNLRGTILCTRKAAQMMIPQKEGKIVMISSAVGIQGKAKYSEYAAAKSGMIGFMKSVALELGPYDINVNCVSPGFIQRGEYDEKQLDYLKKSNAMKKVGSLEDVACAVAFMVSSSAEFITGQNLCVDGGRTLGLVGDTT